MRVKCLPRTKKKNQRKTNLLKNHCHNVAEAVRANYDLRLTENNDLIKSLK